MERIQLANGTHYAELSVPDEYLEVFDVPALVLQEIVDVRNSRTPVPVGDNSRGQEVVKIIGAPHNKDGSSNNGTSSSAAGVASSAMSRDGPIHPFVFVKGSDSLYASSKTMYRMLSGDVLGSAATSGGGYRTKRASNVPEYSSFLPFTIPGFEDFSCFDSVALFGVISSFDINTIVLFELFARVTEMLPEDVQNFDIAKIGNSVLEFIHSIPDRISNFSWDVESWQEIGGQQADRLITSLQSVMQGIYHEAQERFLEAAKVVELFYVGITGGESKFVASLSDMMLKRALAYNATGPTTELSELYSSGELAAISIADERENTKNSTVMTDMVVDFSNQDGSGKPSPELLSSSPSSSSYLLTVDGILQVEPIHDFSSKVIASRYLGVRDRYAAILEDGRVVTFAVRPRKVRSNDFLVTGQIQLGDELGSGLNIRSTNTHSSNNGLRIHSAEMTVVTDPNDKNSALGPYILINAEHILTEGKKGGKIENRLDSKSEDKTETTIMSFIALIDTQKVWKLGSSKRLDLKWFHNMRGYQNLLPFKQEDEWFFSAMIDGTKAENQKAQEGGKRQPVEQNQRGVSKRKETGGRNKSPSVENTATENSPLHHYLFHYFQVPSTVNFEFSRHGISRNVIEQQFHEYDSEILLLILIVWIAFIYYRVGHGEPPVINPTYWNDPRWQDPQNVRDLYNSIMENVERKHKDSSMMTDLFGNPLDHQFGQPLGGAPLGDGVGPNPLAGMGGTNPLGRPVHGRFYANSSIGGVGFKNPTNIRAINSQHENVYGRSGLGGIRRPRRAIDFWD